MEKNTRDLDLKLAQVFSGSFSHIFLFVKDELSSNASPIPASTKGMEGSTWKSLLFP